MGTPLKELTPIWSTGCQSNVHSYPKGFKYINREEPSKKFLFDQQQLRHESPSPFDILSSILNRSRQTLRNCIAWSEDNLIAFSCLKEAQNIDREREREREIPKINIYILSIQDNFECYKIPTSHKYPIVNLSFSPRTYGNLLLCSDSHAIVSIWTRKQFVNEWVPFKRLEPEAISYLDWIHFQPKVLIPETQSTEPKPFGSLSQKLNLISSVPVKNSFGHSGPLYLRLSASGKLSLHHFSLSDNKWAALSVDLFEFLSFPFQRSHQYSRVILMSDLLITKGGEILVSLYENYLGNTISLIRFSVSQNLVKSELKCVSVSRIHLSHPPDISFFPYKNSSNNNHYQQETNSNVKQQIGTEMNGDLKEQIPRYEKEENEKYGVPSRQLLHFRLDPTTEGNVIFCITYSDGDEYCILERWETVITKISISPVFSKFTTSSPLPSSASTTPPPTDPQKQTFRQMNAPRWFRTSSIKLSQKYTSSKLSGNSDSLSQLRSNKRVKISENSFTTNYENHEDENEMKSKSYERGKENRWERLVTGIEVNNYGFVVVMFSCGSLQFFRCSDLKEIPYQIFLGATPSINYNRFPISTLPSFSSSPPSSSSVMSQAISKNINKKKDYNPLFTCFLSSQDGHILFSSNNNNHHHHSSSSSSSSSSSLLLFKTHSSLDPFSNCFIPLSLSFSPQQTCFVVLDHLSQIHLFLCPLSLLLCGIPPSLNYSPSSSSISVPNDDSTQNEIKHSSQMLQQRIISKMELSLIYSLDFWEFTVLLQNESLINQIKQNSGDNEEKERQNTELVSNIVERLVSDVRYISKTNSTIVQSEFLMHSFFMLLNDERNSVDSQIRLFLTYFADVYNSFVYDQSQEMDRRCKLEVFSHLDEYLTHFKVEKDKAIIQSLHPFTEWVWEFSSYLLNNLHTFCSHLHTISNNLNTTFPYPPLTSSSNSPNLLNSNFRTPSEDLPDLCSYFILFGDTIPHLCPGIFLFFSEEYLDQLEECILFSYIFSKEFTSAHLLPEIPSFSSAEQIQQYYEKIFSIISRFKPILSETLIQIGLKNPLPSISSSNVPTPNISSFFSSTPPVPSLVHITSSQRLPSASSSPPQTQESPQTNQTPPQHPIPPLPQPNPQSQTQNSVINTNLPTNQTPSQIPQHRKTLHVQEIRNGINFLLSHLTVIVRQSISEPLQNCPSAESLHFIPIGDQNTHGKLFTEVDVVTRLPFHENRVPKRMCTRCRRYSAIDKNEKGWYQRFDFSCPLCGGSWKIL